MKWYKILQIGLLITIVLGMRVVQGAASEESLTDSTGDVYYQPGGGGDVQTGISTQPNIDISSISYEAGDVNLSFTINVVGQITESAQILYYGDCQSSDATYQFTYTNQSLLVYVETSSGKLPVKSQVDVVGNSLVVMIPLQTEATMMSELYAYAHFYEDPVGLMLGPKYIDTTADIDNDANPSGDSSSSSPPGSGTPGFEVLVFLAALGTIICVFSKKR